MNVNDLISSKKIEQFCQNYHIRQLAFFGSVVRHDFRPDRDIDVLVSFEPGFTPGFDFFLIEEERGELLGRKVGLQTINFLSPEIRSSVFAEAVPAYEQA